VISLDYLPADAEVARRLAVRAGARVVHLVRLRSVNGEPMAIERT
jgi:GntR family transcriptional regulator